jgi:hypothetical protein
MSNHQTAPPVSNGALWTGRLMLWGGLTLRDMSLRALIPLRP